MNKQASMSHSKHTLRFTTILMLYFLSGVSGLVLQVVWMYKLGLVFGNASYATAVTLASFFLGLALGGWYAGRKAHKFSRLLRIYGIIELMIGISAFVLLFGLEYYKTNYHIVVSALTDQTGLLLLAKFVFSCSLIIVPSFLMGGTFPILAQCVSMEKVGFPQKGAILYTVNTIGASLGALLAGFYLLPNFSVSQTYGIAIFISLGVGIGAIILDYIFRAQGSIKEDSLSSKIIPKGVKPKTKSKRQNVNYIQYIILAFSSGLLTLATETIWTKVFSQVLQNSVYSFSAIIVVFLLSLALGGVLSYVLIKYNFHQKITLIILILLSVISLGYAPVVFANLTEGLNYISPDADWSNYMANVFKLVFSIVFLPTLLIGTIYPYLLKALPSFEGNPGSIVGTLIFNNSIGSVIGPILAGFILLEYFGMWMSLKIIVFVYIFLGLWLTQSLSKGQFKNLLLLGQVLSAIWILLLSNPPSVKINENEKLIDIWQSTNGVVTVIKTSDNLIMRLDNYYTLGDAKSIVVEQMQGHIPFLLHSDPKKVLFLGMGTGITAGAALKHNITEVTTVELINNVIIAAEKYFKPWTNNLFDDSRSTIVSDDARNYILGNNRKYDIIIADLFTPWHAGTGSLYTREHFDQIRSRLDTNGIFAQWLPLYQLTPKEFEIIAATISSVFEQVTIWRSDFSGSKSSIALIGQKTTAALDESTVNNSISKVIDKDLSDIEAGNHMAGLFYIGNLLSLKDVLDTSPINTDDQRLIEFSAPISAQLANAGNQSFIVGNALDELLSTIYTNMPPHTDPVLSQLDQDEQKYVTIGLLYYKYLMYNASNQLQSARIMKDSIERLAPQFLTSGMKSN